MGEYADMLIEAEMNDGWLEGETENGESVRIDKVTGEVLEIRKRRKGDAPIISPEAYPEHMR